MDVSSANPFEFQAIVMTNAMMKAFRMRYVGVRRDSCRHKPHLGNAEPACLYHKLTLAAALALPVNRLKSSVDSKMSDTQFAIDHKIAYYER